MQINYLNVRSLDILCFNSMKEIEGEAIYRDFESVLTNSIS